VFLMGLVFVWGVSAYGQITFSGGPAPLNTNADSDFTDATGPDFFDDDDKAAIIRSDGQGNWVAMWNLSDAESLDIKYSRSNDDGATWSDPGTLVAPTGESIGSSEFNVDLVTDGDGTWIAVYEWYHDSHCADIAANRSVDNGLNWSDPIHVDQRNCSGLDLNPSLATDGAGNWIAVWDAQDSYEVTDNEDYDIAYSVSTDDGLTWSEGAPLNSNWDQDTGIIDMRATVATDGAGIWITVWQSKLDGDWDIYYSISTDAGSSWSILSPLSDFEPTDSGNNSAPVITTDKLGKWMVAWSGVVPSRSADGDYDIFYSTSINTGITWSDPALVNNDTATENEHDQNVGFVTDGAGTWFATWERGPYSTAQALYAYSTDFGATWSGPEPIAGGIQEHAPKPATDGNDTWMIAWDSPSTLANATNTDTDVFFVVSDVILPDMDDDGIANESDNCPAISNADQADADSDGVGDACDVCPGFDDGLDGDGDGVPDGCDACAGFDDAVDSDGDSVPDGCDVCPLFNDDFDSDLDGIPDGCDVCPGFDDTADNDGDNAPDACDVCAGFDDTLDSDGDSIPDGCDVCPGGDDAADSDGDSVADGCDICPGFNDAVDSDGDSVADGCDVCPGFDDAVDSDGDSVADGCDVCPGFDDAVDSDEDGVPDGCETIDPSVIGQAGGLLELVGGSLGGSTIFIPPGALGEETQILIQASDPPPTLSPGNRIAAVLELGPFGIVFPPELAATVSLPFPFGDDLKGFTNPAFGVSFYNSEAEAWETDGISNVSFDPSTGLISFDTTRLGVFGILLIKGDVDLSGAIDAIDVQATINAALGLDVSPINADVDDSNQVDAVDVQLVINGALGLEI
jgi:hypothetical protein